MDPRQFAIIGAGIMGSGIAQCLAIAGYDVITCDLDEATLAASLDRIENGRFGLSRAVELGKLTPAAAQVSFRRISTSTSINLACEHADLVIEAVWEDFETKVRTFGIADAAAPPHCILASNTSGFSIAALAGATHRPDRVLGWHWASPAPIMKLAEIVRHPGTSSDAVLTVTEVARRAGKNPEIINDDPLHWGFVTNRILMAAIAEAEQIVSDGVANKEQIDRLVKDGMRWPAGLFELVQNAGHNWDENERASDRPDKEHRLKLIRSTDSTNA